MKRTLKELAFMPLGILIVLLIMIVVTVAEVWKIVVSEGLIFKWKAERLNEDLQRNDSN